MMRIPRLPIKLDMKGIVEGNIDLFRRLAAGKAVSEAECMRAGIPETLLFQSGGSATLSEWGALLWEQEWRVLAEQKLWPARNGKVTYSKRFESEVAKLPPARIRNVNDAIEALVLRLEGDIAGKRKSFTFKPLEGDPVPPATDELYAWTDGDAGRIFLYDSKDGWIANSIGPHL